MSPDQQLALAALDPNAAIKAAVVVVLVPQTAAQAEAVVGREAREVRLRGLTMAVEVDPPVPYKRWRFFIFYQLVRLAAWFYPFKFEIYRTAQPSDEE